MEGFRWQVTVRGSVPNTLDGRKWRDLSSKELYVRMQECNPGDIPHTAGGQD